MKKLKNILIWLGIITYMILSISFVSRKEQRLLCNSIEVEIKDSIRNRFIEEQDIIKLFDKQGFEIRGIEIDRIDTKMLESSVNALPEVKNAEIYKTVDGSIRVEIKQREPIIRIIDKNGRHFYLDTDGYLLPISKKHTSHVLVANGNIPSVKLKDNISLTQAYLQTPENRDIAFLYSIYSLAAYIHNNDFWNAQFVQLYVDKNRESELIPRVGAHIIQLGDIHDYQYKLFKLKALYFKGFNALGWNNYEIINLKYSNQVVCTKR